MMQELLRAGAAFVVEAAVFFILGSLLMHKLKMKTDGALAFLMGFLLYFSLFEILAVPMTLLWVRLHVLCIVMCVLLGLILIYALAVLRKQWAKQLRSVSAGALYKEHSWFIVPAVAAVLLQCMIVALYQDTTLDATYYVGTVSTALYTDTMQRYSPYSGLLQHKMNARYVFSAFPISNAFWCRVMGIHPIVQCKIVMSVLNTLAANLTMYQIGKRLFKGGKKQADLMLCFVCLLQLFTFTGYTPGTLFFIRSFEGKAMLANISFPLVLYCTLWLWQEGGRRDMWIMLFLTALSALHFSGSAAILPAAMAAGILPVMIMRRERSGVIPFLICMVPSGMYMVLYALAKIGLLTLRAS